jgi:hypothetical protein
VKVTSKLNFNRKHRMWLNFLAVLEPFSPKAVPPCKRKQVAVKLKWWSSRSYFPYEWLHFT